MLGFSFQVVGGTPECDFMDPKIDSQSPEYECPHSAVYNPLCGVATQSDHRNDQEYHSHEEG